MENNNTFVSGLYLNKVSDNAPSFIITNQSIHLETLFNWLKANKGLADEKGYIRIVGKESKEGKRYFQVDTWKPKVPELDSVDYGDKSTPNQKGIDMSEFGEANIDNIPF